MIAAALAAAGLGAAPALAADPPRLAIYGQLPSLEQMVVSPSGDHTAMLMTIGGQRIIGVFDKAGAIIQKFDAGGLKVRGLEWAGDAALLVDFTSTVGLGFGFTTAKAELGSTVVVQTDGSKPWTVFAKSDRVAGGTTRRYGTVRRNGRWFGYFGGIATTKTTAGAFVPDGEWLPSLWEVDLKTGEQRLVAGHAAEDSRRDWLVDANGAVAVTLDRSGKTGEWRLLGPKQIRLAAGTGLDSHAWLVGFSPDGASVIYGLRDDTRQLDDWFTVPLTGGEPARYLPDQAIRRSFFDDSRRLIGYVDDSPEGRAHFFDDRLQKIYAATVRAFPGKRVELKDANSDFTKLVVTTEGDGDPQVWWQVDIATGNAAEVGSAYALAADQVGAVRLVPYKAADGLAMAGVLTLPPPSIGAATGKLPAVILPHGGPASYDVPGFDWIAQAFASRGYAVFQPNFRGSTGYGAAFEAAGHGEWGRLMQTDLSDGLAELVRQGIVDPARVCIVGASYGGYAALAGVSLQQGIYRCAVSIAGIGDVAKMVATEKWASGGDPTLARALKQEVGAGKDLAAVSPIRHVDAVNVPVMLIHGTNDTVVDPDQSNDMAIALRKAGKPVEYVALPKEDHWLSTSETRQQMLEAAVNFVMKANPPTPGAR